MKNIGIVIMLFSLTACGGNDMVTRTVPGTPLAATFAICEGHDEAGRCSDWEPHTDQCVNPKGIDAKPMIVPCASIKKANSTTTH